MVSVTVLLKANKANGKGELPLYIRITKRRSSKFISLGIRIHPNQWNAEKNRVKSRFPNSGRVNSYIARKIAEAEDLAVTMETKEQYVTSKKIKEAIKGREPVSIIIYIEDYLKDLKAKGKIGTYDKYHSTLLKLKAYLKGKDLSFDDFDLQFLKTYERYLRDDQGNCANTIHGNLKVFRKIFNDAVREELIEPQLNPFLKYKLKWEKTKKEYLTEEELTSIEDLQLPDDSMLCHHRNMFVLAAYAGGIRISDLLQLKWRNFDGSHLRLYMQKTNDSIQIKLPTKALEIIKRYAAHLPERSPNHYIFPVLTNDKDYSDPVVLFKAKASAIAYANKNLKTIAKMAGVRKPVSFHCSRHTWATRALRKGMRIEYVSKLMGHASVKSTEIYTKIVSAELDNAMKLFDAVND